MIHIIIGDLAAENLVNAFELDENLKGEVLILKDTLGIGPLKVEEGKSFDEMRTDFWKQIIPEFEQTCEDESKLNAVIAKAQQEEEPVCFWMSPCVTDVTAYYWLLNYFKPFPGMLHVISINGLPFLNEKGQLFYPNNFSQIIPREFIKTKRLLKEVSPAEYETDIDEWARFIQEDTWVRIHEGSKKIASKEVTHFDTLLKNSISEEFQKGSKIVNETMKKITQTVSNQFIEWRLRELIAQGLLTVNGNLTKGLKDFEVKKNSETEPAQSEVNEVVE